MNLLRRKVATGQYELTHHAKQEIEQDRFTIQDVKSGIYSGRIVEVQRHGSERRKDVVEGRATDDRAIRIVCRMTAMWRLRIITVFASGTT